MRPENIFIFRTAIIITFSLLISLSGRSQDEQPEPLSKSEKSEVIDSISTILEREYVFPEIAGQISKHLHDKSEKGNYDHVSDPFEFANLLTEDIQSINGDKHMRVAFRPGQIAEIRNAVSPEDSLALVEKRRRQGQMANYGFKEVKILEGNIGYLNLTGFFGVTEKAGQVAQSAMNFLSNADALIIDLRANGGGSPAMIQLISSYLFSPDPVHLNSFYYRPQNQTTQTWTLPYVPGKRRPNRDVYVLTSGRTFSAAEEFSYNLRNLKRATLVGEVTGGGAHPGGTRIASERFTVWVPSGRAINPISETNWEGTGVQPHVEVPAEQALEEAKILAIEKLLEKCDDAQQKFGYQWALDGWKAAKESATPDHSLLQSYAGVYGPRILTYKDGILYYQRQGNQQHPLIPMSDDKFMIEEIPYFRLKVLVENGQSIGVMGMYDDGRTDRNMRGPG